MSGYEKVFGYTGEGSQPGSTMRIEMVFDGKDYTLTVRDGFATACASGLSPEAATILNDFWSDHLVKVRASSQRPPVSPPKLYAVPSSNGAPEPPRPDLVPGPYVAPTPQSERMAAAPVQGDPGDETGA